MNVLSYKGFIQWIGAFLVLFGSEAFGASNLSLPFVLNTNALKAIPSTQYLVVEKLSGSANVPSIKYNSSNSVCPLNSGNGDDVTQVKSPNGGCWIAERPAEGFDVSIFGSTYSTSLASCLAAAPNMGACLGGALAGPTKPTHSLNFPTLGSVPISAQWVDIGSYPAGGLIPAGTPNGYTSTMVVPSSYSQAPWPVTNYSAYSDDSNTAAGGSTVNYFGVATTRNANIGGWSFNGILSNTDPAHAISGANLGNDFGSLVGYECNPNIWKKPGAVTPSGISDCIKFIGGGQVVPSAGAFALHVYPFSTGLQWTSALYTEDNSASNAINLGAALAAGINVGSQAINFRGYEGAGAPIAGSLSLDAAQAILTSATNGLRVIASGTTVSNITTTTASFLRPILAGSLTQSLDANAIFLGHVATDKNLEIRGNISLADGVTIQSVNDALSASKNLEIIATGLQLTANTLIINGTGGVTCVAAPTAAFRTINGIVTAC